MPVAHKTGDLFCNKESVLAHGVNCAGAMGKGIALEFRSRWPEMYKDYKDFCHRGMKPGDVHYWSDGKDCVLNLATQEHWCALATIDAIVLSLSRAVAIASSCNINRIAMPRVGTGLGGLTWYEVSEAINFVGDRTAVELVVYSGAIGNNDLQIY